MIGRLKGTVAAVSDTGICIDVGGVGYDVSVNGRLLSRLSVDEPVTLVIETLVAETFIRLVGFETEAERAAFRLLQTVQGVGAKAALAILDVLRPTELAEAVSLGDKTAIARAQGVGPKLAARVASELKSRMGTIFGNDGAAVPAGLAVSAGGDPSRTDDARRDAVAALMSLGFDESAAVRAVTAVAAEENMTAEALVTAALKSVAAA